MVVVVVICAGWYVLDMDAGADIGPLTLASTSAPSAKVSTAASVSSPFDDIPSGERHPNPHSKLHLLPRGSDTGAPLSVPWPADVIITACQLFWLEE
jgi:hypothetical protein